MLTPLLDQTSRDGVGLAVLRRLPIDARLLEVAPRGRVELLPHELFRHVPRGRDEHEPGDAGCLRGSLAQEPAQEQQRDPPAHAGADDDLGPVRRAPKHCLGLGEPLADGAVLEATARYAVPGVVEARAAVALLRANSASAVALVLAMSDL